MHDAARMPCAVRVNLTRDMRAGIARNEVQILTGKSTVFAAQVVVPNMLQRASNPLLFFGASDIGHFTRHTVVQVPPDFIDSRPAETMNINRGIIGRIGRAPVRRSEWKHVLVFV